jgi:hypothetical protein
LSGWAEVRKIDIMNIATTNGARLGYWESGHDHLMEKAEVGHTDTEHTTCLHVPSVGLVVAGDATYNDVQLEIYPGRANPGSFGVRRTWSNRNFTIIKDNASLEMQKVK